MRFLLAACLTLTFHAPLKAEWAKVPILEVPERINGGVLGKLRGNETLALIHGPKLLLVGWDGSDWTQTELEIQSPSERGTPVFPSLGGIGAALDLDSGNVKVAALMAGLAAAVDGRLRVGDRIEAVAQNNGPFVETRGNSMEQIISMIRGTAGTVVRLRILPGGDPSAKLAIISLTRTGLAGIAAIPPAFKRRGAVTSSAFGVGVKTYPLAILDGHNDGVARLYLGLPGELLEYTPQPGHWKIERTDLSGNDIDEMEAAISNVDGRARIYTCALYKNSKISECSWSGKWECRGISEPCSGPFVVNVRGVKNTDVIFGAGKILTRKKGEDWKTIEKFFVDRDIVASADLDRMLIGTKGLTEVSADFSKYSTRGFETTSGELISAGQARVEVNRPTRVFVGSDDWHVYEVRNPTGIPVLSDMGRARGVPWYLLPGDLRGTGVQHLYVSEERGNTNDPGVTTISEYTYYENKSITAVLGFELGHSSGVDASPIGGAVLGNLLRAEMLKFGHLQLIETENVDKITAEREFQSSQCADDGCLARIGKLLNAQAIMKGAAAPVDGGYRISLKVVEAESGRELLSRSRRVEAETDIPKAIVLLARSCALDWPHKLAGARKPR